VEKAGHIANKDIYDLFNLPLSIIAQEELNDLQEEFHNITFNTANDEWSFTWGNKFSTKKLCRALIGEHNTPEPILDIWKSCAITPQQFFAWLLLNGKLNSKEMMKKNFFVEFSKCILCESNIEESIIHLFFECSLS
jgi:hypothetical protein